MSCCFCFGFRFVFVGSFVALSIFWPKRHIVYLCAPSDLLTIQIFICFLSQCSLFFSLRVLFFCEFFFLCIVIFGFHASNKGNTDAPLIGIGLHTPQYRKFKTTVPIQFRRYTYYYYGLRLWFIIGSALSG